MDSSIAVSTSEESQPSMLRFRNRMLVKNNTMVGMMVRVTKAATSFVRSFVPSTPLFLSRTSFATLRVTRKMTSISNTTFRLIRVKITMLLGGGRLMLLILVRARLSRAMRPMMMKMMMISLFRLVIPEPYLSPQ